MTTALRTASPLATRPMTTPVARGRSLQGDVAVEVAGPPRSRPMVGFDRTGRRGVACRPVPAALPRLSELALAAIVVAVLVLVLGWMAPSAPAGSAAPAANGELVVTVAEGETLDDVLARIGNGVMDIDLGEQIVRLNGGRELHAGQQFVVVVR